MPLNPRITDWTHQHVWIIGASSGIGQAVAQHLHHLGAKLAVSARRADALHAQFPDGTVHCLPCDITELAAIHDCAKRLKTLWPRIDLVLIVAGTYTPMHVQDWNLSDMQRLLMVNVGGVYNVVDAVLPTLRAQRSGGIGIVSSVVGYRGLPKALAYGPTKAALINFAESLYLDCREDHIAVYLINPGFVRTPLTALNDFEMPALIDADTAAKALVEGLSAGQFEIHFPRRFTFWMKLARQLPHRWYFALVKRVIRR